MNAEPPQLNAPSVRHCIQEHEDVPVMAILGGFDIHRPQVTSDYLDTETGRRDGAGSTQAAGRVLR
jgi:hypothetical protein